VPKRRFTTDSAGRVPAGVTLLPSTVYRVEHIDGPPVTRLNNIDELILWIRDCVLGDLRTLSRGMEQQVLDPKPGFGGGNFLLFAGCLMALEYFARIYTAGGDAVTRVQNYAQDFLVPINARYGIACGILWRAARNGMIHGSWPQRLSVAGESSEYKFFVGNDARDAHLSFQDGGICVSAPRLLVDLEGSVDLFVSWLRKMADPETLERSQPRRLALKSSDSEAENLRLMAQWSVG
jgi:hypothetical protein